MNRRPAFAAVAAGALLFTTIVGCSSDDEASTDTTAAAAEGGCDPLPLKEAGALTVATGEPAFEPWVVDDDPASGEGFEAAVVAAVAEQLGIDDVTWTRTGFDEAIAPGDKSYDFNVQQYSITEARDEVVDFSDAYYEVEQAIVASSDNPVARATSVADLADARLGAAIGTTSLDYIEEVIQPATQPLAFDDNAAAKAAFDAGQVDGIVFDLPTAYYITAVEIEGSSIVGVLPQQGEAEGLGFLFEDGSPLVPCVNDALGALRDDGTLDALEEQWLNQGGDIPTLEP
jgi:polar amino acid transport system substrate-binding protein